MAISDQPYDQALLYLRAAGHDTGAETRGRLHRLLRHYRAGHLCLSTAQLLEKLPQWFDLPAANPGSLSPPIRRASIGYPDA